MGSAFVVQPRRVLVAIVAMFAAGVGACGEGPMEPAGPFTYEQPCPTDRVHTFDARQIVGETEADAAEVLRQNGCVLRVVVRDRQSIAPPSRSGDHRSVDVAVTDGRVTSVRPFED